MTADTLQRYDSFPETSWDARNLSTPKVSRPLEMRCPASVRALSWSCDGRRVAVGMENRNLRVWEVNRDGAVTERNVTLQNPHKGNIGSVAFSPTDPNLLVSACKGVKPGVIAIWNLVPRNGSTPASQPVTTFTLSLDIMHIAFHPSGTQFAAVSAGNVRDEVTFFWLQDGVWCQRDDVLINGAGAGGPDPDEQVNSLRFGNGGRTVLAASRDGALTTWWYPTDARRFDEQEEAERPAKRARILESPNEEAGREPTPEPELEVDKEAEAADRDAADAPGTPAADPATLVVQGDDVPEGEEVPEGGEDAAEGEGAEQGLEASQDGVPAINEPDNTNDGDAIMEDGSRAATPLPHPTRPSTPSAPQSAAPSAPATRQPSPVKDEKTDAEKEKEEAAAKAAASAAERAAKEAHNRLVQLERGPKRVVGLGLYMALAVDPRGRYYALGGNDARITLVSTTTRSIARVFNDMTSPLRTVAFSADGEFLAAGGDNELLLLSVASGAVVARVPAIGRVDALTWSPKGSLAYATNSRTRIGWNVVGVSLDKLK